MTVCLERLRVPRWAQGLLDWGCGDPHMCREDSKIPAQKTHPSKLEKNRGVGD